MGKILILLMTLVLFAKPSKAQNKACKKFRTGRFLLLDTNSKNYIIERNDTIQWETAENSLIKSEFYIHWKDDCHYQLTLKKIHHRPPSLKLPDKPMKLFVTINKTSGDTCWVTTGSNLSDFTQTNRMVIIQKDKNE